MTNTLGFDTRAIHAGSAPDPTTGARATPIYQTTSYAFENVAHAASLFNLEKVGYIYTRLTNPTTAVLQERIASLEGGAGAVATSSGHAAQLLTLFALLSPGDEFIAANQLYGGTINQFSNSFPQAFGWKATFVDGTDAENFRRALTPKTKAIFIESIANPGGIIFDLEAIGKIAQEAAIPLIVDNTMATPYLYRPIELGATLVIHSTTKFISGNGTSIGGIVVDSGTFDWKASGKYPALSEPNSGYHGLVFADAFGPLAFTFYGIAAGLRDLGTNQQPLNSFLTLLGLETLSLRMERHNSNALQVAKFLENHSQVTWISYSGLESSPYYQNGKKYTPLGCGAVMTFGIKGGYEAGIKMVENVRLFSHLANIGDVRSLIIHPASTTHRQVAPEQLADSGAGPDVVRLSIGLETIDDIISDLDQALNKSAILLRA